MNATANPSNIIELNRANVLLVNGKCLDNRHSVGVTERRLPEKNELVSSEVQCLEQWDGERMRDYWAVFDLV